MLLLRRERFLLRYLANRMKGHKEFLNTARQEEAGLLALTDLLVHEDTLFFDLRGRDFEYQERIYSDEVIKMLYNSLNEKH